MRGSRQNAHHGSVAVSAGGALLRGDLNVPKQAEGVVLFAHGSGSGRLSPRNRFVACTLQGGGLATLLIDLLEDEEAGDRRKVFDIDLLADRLLAATDWLARQAVTRGHRLCYFGAGAGAALEAAARAPASVAAVVSRGGRPDLAASYLPKVVAPTLLIVGGRDDPVIEMNRGALDLLTCQKELVIVPGATHLFEEPGALEQVSDLALRWFRRHLTPPG